MVKTLNKFSKDLEEETFEPLLELWEIEISKTTRKLINEKK